MSRASLVIVLCEDRLQEVAARRFFGHWGLTDRNLRVVPYPEGSGSGEAHVTREYPRQLEAYRARAFKASTVLAVIADADSGEVRDRIRGFHRACESADPPVRGRQAEDSRVVHFIPRRHIETWLAFLNGVNVDEDTSYKSRYAFRGRESEVRPLIERLARSCRGHDVLADMPDSLRQACDEFERIRDVLQ